MNIRIRTIVVDCFDAAELSSFYSRLLGWEITESRKGWVLLRDPEGGTGLSFQEEPMYVPPVWPDEPGKRQKMLHLDFLVDDLEEACRHAAECGAVKAGDQFLPDVVVLFDPAGHPFCLFTDPSYK